MGPSSHAGGRPCIGRACGAPRRRRSPATPPPGPSGAPGSPGPRPGAGGVVGRRRGHRVRGRHVGARPGGFPGSGTGAGGIGPAGSGVVGTWSGGRGGPPGVGCSLTVLLRSPGRSPPGAAARGASARNRSADEDVAVGRRTEPAARGTGGPAAAPGCPCPRCRRTSARPCRARLRPCRWCPRPAGLPRAGPWPCRGPRPGRDGNRRSDQLMTSPDRDAPYSTVPFAWAGARVQPSGTAGPGQCRGRSPGVRGAGSSSHRRGWGSSLVPGDGFGATGSRKPCGAGGSVVSGSGSVVGATGGRGAGAAVSRRGSRAPGATLRRPCRGRRRARGQPPAQEVLDLVEAPRPRRGARGRSRGPGSPPS